MFGQWLHLSDERVRTLVAAGAAGGIAAAFNAPIAGVFFALEIIVGEWTGSMFGVVVLSSVISAVFTQAVSGPQPAFKVPAYAFQSVGELPLYLGLGLLAGPLSALYIRALYFAQDVFHGLSLPRWSKPAIAGLIIGVAGLFLPQLLGVGYSTIEQILGGQPFPVMLLIALLIGKLIMTPVSIGGGFPGGVFAPSLFLGAALGAVYGSIVQQIFPTLNVVPAAYAMVGMAAVLAGAVHAPLTAIILSFEMTNDYRIILPVMFAVAISLVVSQRLQHDSVYVHGLARKGIRIERGRDVDVLEALTVDAVMQTDVTILHESDSLANAADVFMQTRHHGLPVVNDRAELVGILTVQDLEHTHTNGNTAPQLVGEVCTRELLVTYPDETIGAALRRMSTRDVGRLPVVARDNPRHLVGVLRRTDLVRAYDIALTHRAETRHRAHQVRLGALSGVTVEEVVVEVNAPCANKRLSEVKWPRDSVIATLRRGKRIVIPHGDTLLKAGDVLVIAAEGEAREQVRRMCSAA
jgi:CIC family chloride channel protein